jgi:hypothetical protein
MASPIGLPTLGPTFALRTNSAIACPASLYRNISDTDAATLLVAVDPATPARKLKMASCAMLSGKAHPMLKIA